MGGRAVGLGLPVDLGLAAADLEAGGGRLPGLLRGAPAPLALAHQLLLLGAALLAGVCPRAGDRPHPPPPGPAAGFSNLLAGKSFTGQPIGQFCEHELCN